MVRHQLHGMILWAITGAAILPSAGIAQQRQLKEITHNREKELVVDIEVSFGEVIISRGASSKILVAEFQSPLDDDEFKVDYSVRDGTGRLSIHSKERSDFWGKKDEEEGRGDRKWVLQFTDAIPISLSMELGAGTGEIDLSGLQIERMKISSGASTVSLTCDQPNPIRAEVIDIESGVSKFTARNLANTNFRKLRFSGGVGAYKLDFGGTLRQDADASIEVGLGAVTISLPDHLPVRVLYDDSWFSSFDVDDAFTKRRNGVYETSDYSVAQPTLSIQIESGLGSVKVRRK